MCFRISAFKVWGERYTHTHTVSEILTSRCRNTTQTYRDRCVCVWGGEVHREK